MMDLKWRVWSMIAVWGIAASPVGAHAGQVVVGNLNQPPGQLSPSQIDPEDFWAEEFTTGGGSYTLTHILASLGGFDRGNNGDFTLTAQLFAVTSQSETPDQGTLVATLTQNGSVPTNGFANVEFDSPSGVTLSPSLSYWFVLSGSSSDGTGAAQWQFTDNPAPPNSYGPGSLPNFARITVSSGPWTAFPDFPFLVEVDAAGTAVPEPSSAVLGGFGLAFVFALRGLVKLRRNA
jgi:hypothetical protein